MKNEIKNWTASDIPKSNGGLAVVTGGTEGIGFQDVLALASSGWHVIMTGRDPKKGLESIVQVHKLYQKANVSFEKIDLADLSSIKAFGDRMQEKGRPIDLLINNAGIMTPPKRLETADGLEIQFGTNHIGHFALTAHLLPLLSMANNPRVVTVSSIGNRNGKINFDDLQSRSSYKPMEAYAQSKLANLMFAFELQRQSDKNGWGIMSLSAHPGVSRTNLLITGAGRWSSSGIMRTFLPFMFQPPAMGALPTLFAATSPGAEPGAYYGPNKLSETRGFPTPAKIPVQAEEKIVAQKLWDVSLELANVTFDNRKY
jgi:NAD(P)-dependent dehydrogenase (short-subunit alcohol dehydrogenase family)